MPLIPSPAYPGVYFTDLLDAEGGVYSDAVDGWSSSWLMWRGLVIAPLSDRSTPFHLSDIQGWDVTPQVSFADVNVAGGRGVAVTPGEMGPRIVTVTGWCFDPLLRNKLLAILRGNSAPSVGKMTTESLAIVHGGIELTASAQLIKADATAEVGWGGGRFGFSLQWRCTDPLRYGQSQSFSAPINTSQNGITWPITFPITFPANPRAGVVTVNNPGNADLCPAVITLTGPLSTPGVVCVETSRRLEFPLELGAEDVLSIDTDAGVALLNGEFRAPSAVSSLIGDLSLAPGTQTLQALGTPTTGDPSISVSFRPAYW